MVCIPDPTARMPDCGGLIMAQNCLIPNGPPKLDTVKVPPYKRIKLVIKILKPQVNLVPKASNQSEILPTS